MGLDALQGDFVHLLRRGRNDYGGDVKSALPIGAILLHRLDASGDGASYSDPLCLCSKCDDQREDQGCEQESRSGGHGETSRAKCLRPPEWRRVSLTQAEERSRVRIEGIEGWAIQAPAHSKSARARTGKRRAAGMTPGRDPARRALYA